MKNLHKTLLFTIIFSLIIMTSLTLVQLNSQGEIEFKCSYLDPVTIDVLAFLAAVFLVVEGSSMEGCILFTYVQK